MVEEDFGVNLKAKSQNKCIEMIWFGGINSELYNNVFHVTLTLDYKDSDSLNVKTG